MKGTVHVSRDKGGTWDSVSIALEPRSSSMAPSYCSVYTLGTTVVVVGDDVLLVGQTSGNSLRQVVRSSNNRIHELCVTADSQGFWVSGGTHSTGGYLVRSDGSAAQWREISLPAGTKMLHGVASNGSGVLYAVGEKGTALCSTDGAKNWSILSVPSEYDYLSVWAKDNNVFVSANRDVVIRSQDAGQTWQIVRGPAQNDPLIYAIRGTKGAIVVAAAEGITLAKDNTIVLPVV